MRVLTFRFRWFFAFLMAATFAPWPAEGQTRPTSRTKTAPDFALKASQYMRARARVTGFSGAVLFARGDGPIFRQSYGLANREFGIPNTPTMKFRAGSAGKQFTAAAIHR